MPTAKRLFFTAPKQVEIRNIPLSPLKADEVLVETICSAVSAGTEMLVYRGQCPALDDAHDALSSEVKYPLAYGYACVGIVRETGAELDSSWRDKFVFAFQPHTSHFITTPNNLLRIPNSLSPESACFFPNMETAVNLVQDGAPLLGERVLVLGQGVVGLLTASLLQEFPVESLVTSDRYAIRRKASLEIGADDSFDPALLMETPSGSANKRQGSVNKPNFDYAQNCPTTSTAKTLLAYAQHFDLTFELSGSPAALNDAIALTAFSGRIVIGSWYGDKRAEIDLGGAFHRSRIKLIASQVSTIPPELSGRWDKARRFGVAWEALKRIQPEKWITHRFSIDDAEQAYRLLDEQPHETIQVIFDYEV